MSPVFVIADSSLTRMVGWRPFFEHILEWLRIQGVHEVTFCSPNKSDLGQGMHVQIHYATEIPVVPSALVLRADRLFTVDLALFERFATADVNVALHYARSAGEEPRVTLDRDYNITKIAPSPLPDGFIDGGVYLLRGEAVKRASESLAVGARGIPSGGRLIHVNETEPDLAAWFSDEPRPCLFLDRDGVIVEHVNYLHEPDKVVLVPEVTQLIRGANARGWRVVMVSNQSGVGRGLFDESQCDATNARIRDKLAAAGAAIDTYSCCFEHPREGRGAYLRESVRRKPGAGMLLEACSQFKIDVSASLMIGDNETDQIDLPGLRAMLIKGDFVFKNVRPDTVVSEDFAQLGKSASAFLDGRAPSF